MSLLPNELDIIKQQLGVSLTRIGAEPYITYTAIFDKVVQPYLYDNYTTSSTAVASAGTQVVTLAANPAAPNNSALLTYNVGQTCVIDVGPSQELATIQVLSGLSATFTFANTHPAGFQIYPAGAEYQVRQILARISAIETQMLTVAPITAGMSQVDDSIRIFASSKGSQRGATLDKFGSLQEQRMAARDDLAGAIGFANLWRTTMKAGGTGGYSGRAEVY